MLHKLSETDASEGARVLLARILVLEAGDSETLEVSVEHNQAHQPPGLFSIRSTSPRAIYSYYHTWSRRSFTGTSIGRNKLCSHAP
jgi:hypothetical protein